MTQPTALNHRTALANWAALLAAGAHPFDLLDATYVMYGVLEKAKLPKDQENALCDLLDLIDIGEEFGDPAVTQSALNEFAQATARLVEAEQLAEAA
jgi:hypothetical protein